MKKFFVLVIMRHLLFTIFTSSPTHTVEIWFIANPFFNEIFYLTKTNYVNVIDKFVLESFYIKVF